ncbi:hypothetical protein [Aliikangiella coralliicola]|uniref:Uncharacterized protein n=1 Tax=Aliikangiella coralliicola TaxID=2592383 RepID=A0A545UER6_9GAMM|nr:hypothetical protein [Aliikangiella coralliicola]TQV87967.1 hypothetical protein FLL46_09125 [Aliikangiella coralliicola]
MKKFANEFLGLLFALLVLNVWYFSSLAVEQEVIPKNLEYLTKAAIGIMSAFIGAYFAFKLNRDKGEAELEKEHVTAINTALFTIAKQFFLLHTLKQNLDEFREDKSRFITCPAINYGTVEHIALDYKSLNFLIEKEPTFLLDLYVEEERFRSAINHANRRHDILVEQVHPKLQMEPDISLFSTPDALADVVGKHLAYSVFHTTNRLYHVADAAYSSTYSMQKKMFKLAKKHYPKRTFVKYSLKDDN